MVTENRRGHKTAIIIKHTPKLYEVTVIIDTYFPDVVKICDFWGQSAVYTQELLVHKCSQGKTVEGVHTCVIHPLWILNSTCHEGKQGRERRARQVKQHCSLTLGQCASLGWKSFPKCQKTSHTHFKNCVSSVCPTEIVLTFVNIKKVKNLTESCRSQQGTFK